MEAPPTGKPSMTVLSAATPEDVLAAVEWAVAEEAPIEIVGHGTKRGIGRPLRVGHGLDLSAMTGVTLYEPEELVLSARAGTPIAEVETMLAEKSQQFAFEPIDYRRLLGGSAVSARAGTLGGMLAANLAGPRRIKTGAARDHVLGVTAVSGRGEMFRSGGRVVKNVTGYDLAKLMAGSWGTLAVVTDLTFKVLPAAETETTMAIRGLTDAGAAAAMALAMGSSADVSGAAHLPEGLALRVAEGSLGSEAATLLRLEGFGPSVADRIAALEALLAKAGPISKITDAASRLLWREIRDCVPFADGSGRPVWRVSAPPSKAHEMVMALRMEAGADAFYDWQGGLAWLRMEADPEAEAVRRLLHLHGGGHATLVRASPEWRASVPVFEPQPRALAALSARVKSQFDPGAILNPGRMTPHAD